MKETAPARSTQTNEAGRTAVLLPLLGPIDGPLSLIEVGASAGLCLYPDRYSYLYDGRHRLDPTDGPSPVLLRCSTTVERTVRALPCRWISDEGPSVLPHITDRIAAIDVPIGGRFVVSLDGRPRALTGAHGQSLDWLH